MTGELLRYPWRSVGPDYARSLIGLLFTAGPIILVTAAPVVVVVLGTMAALFAMFAVRTALRHRTAIELSGTGIRSQGPLRRHVAWDGLRTMKLAYYTTRRDRTKGWMHLYLKGDHGGVSLDSGIDGFPEVVRMAYGAARRRGVALNRTTLANIAAMGIAVDDGSEATRP